MSRSHKHTSICGIAAAKSEKYDKRVWNRYFRKRTRHVLATQGEYDLTDCPLYIRKETETWCGAKDGRQWFDASEYPEYMRK